MKIAFYVVFPNEFVHFEPLRRHLPEAEYVVGYHRGEEDHRSHTLQLLRQRGLPCVDLAVADLGNYDAYVSRYFKHGELLFPSRTRRVRTLYGYTNKNNFTFAPENAFYDAVLSYGPFATRHLEPFAPCFEVGNMMLDSALQDCGRVEGTGSGKPRVLYLPTWGSGDCAAFNFTSAEVCHPYLSRLADHFELFIKLHPDAAAYAQALLPLYRSVPGATVVEPHEDIKPLMRSCAAVISDFSGTIFEAIGLGIPVVLLSRSAESPFTPGRCFLSLNEEEDRSLYQELGVPCPDPQRLAESVFQAIQQGPAREEIRNLFYRPEHLDGQAGARAAEAIRAMVARPAARNNTQEQMRRSLYQGGFVSSWDAAARCAVELQRADLLANVLEAKRAATGATSILPVGSAGLKESFAALRFLSRNAHQLGISRVRAIREGVRFYRSPLRLRQMLAGLLGRVFKLLDRGPRACPAPAPSEVMPKPEPASDCAAPSTHYAPKTDRLEMVSVAGTRGGA